MVEVAAFPSSNQKMVVTVRIVSFISVDQARLNIDAETPIDTLLEDTIAHTRAAWTDKLEEFKIEGNKTQERVQRISIGQMDFLRLCACYRLWVLLC